MGRCHIAGSDIAGNIAGQIYPGNAAVNCDLDKLHFCGAAVELHTECNYIVVIEIFLVIEFLKPFTDAFVVAAHCSRNCQRRAAVRIQDLHDAGAILLKAVKHRHGRDMELRVVAVIANDEVINKRQTAAIVPLILQIAFRIHSLKVSYLYPLLLRIPCRELIVDRCACGNCEHHCKRKGCKSKGSIMFHFNFPPLFLLGACVSPTLI